MENKIVILLRNENKEVFFSLLVNEKDEEMVLNFVDSVFSEYEEMGITRKMELFDIERIECFYDFLDAHLDLFIKKHTEIKFIRTNVIDIKGD